MSDRWGIIDTSGDLPRIDARALAAVLTGTLLWGWYVGLVELLRGIGVGISNGLLDASAWLSGDAGLIAAVFGIAANVTGEVARKNAEFLTWFGPFAQLAALIEGVLILALITVTVIYVIRRLFEVLP